MLEYALFGLCSLLTQHSLVFTNPPDGDVLGSDVVQWGGAFCGGAVGSLAHVENTCLRRRFATVFGDLEFWRLGSNVEVCSMLRGG